MWVCSRRCNRRTQQARMANMILLSVILLLDAARSFDPTTYCADLIELNHYHDPSSGCHRFTQVIIWNWKPEVREHHVDCWWIVSHPDLLPRRTPIGHIATRFDGVSIKSKSYRETWTTIDPEQVDKLQWCETRRLKYPPKRSTQ